MALSQVLRTLKLSRLRTPEIAAARHGPIARRLLCSRVDAALEAALTRVADQIRQIDGTAQPAPAPGVKTPGPKMLLRFTCTHSPCDAPDEQRVNLRTISKGSYERGAPPCGPKAIRFPVAATLCWLPLAWQESCS